MRPEYQTLSAATGLMPHGSGVADVGGHIRYGLTACPPDRRRACLSVGVPGGRPPHIPKDVKYARFRAALPAGVPIDGSTSCSTTSQPS